MHEDAIHNKIKGKCEEQLTVEKEVGEQVEHVDAQATEFLHEQSLLQYQNFQNLFFYFPLAESVPLPFEKEEGGLRLGFALRLHEGEACQVYNIPRHCLIQSK